MAGFRSILITAALFGSVGALSAQEQPAVERSSKVHAGLYEVSSSTADGSIWVAAVGSSTAEGARLVALDPVTLEERRFIDMDDAPGFGVAINNRTQTLYTSNTRVGTMSAVNLATGEITIIERPDAEGYPHLYRVVVDEANNRVYATAADTPGNIWVVDGATNTLERVIENVGARPTGLALDAEANRLYAANIDDDEIAVIDLSTYEVISKIPTQGETSTQLAFDPATKRLFVGNQGTNDISVIDVATETVLRKVPVGTQPVGVAYHPEADRIYVAARGDGVLTVIDGTSYEHIADVEIGTFPNTIHIDATSGKIYVTNKARRAPADQPNAVDPNGDMVTVLRP